MFVSTCTSCEKRMLIFPSQITGMARIDGVVAATYTCWCGAEQLWHTGEAEDERAEEPAPPVAHAA
jgi:hypothetical protein